MLIFFLFLHENICCGYSLEVPHWITPLICRYESAIVMTWIPPPAGFKLRASSSKVRSPNHFSLSLRCLLNTGLTLVFLSFLHKNIHCGYSWVFLVVHVLTTHFLWRNKRNIIGLDNSGYQVNIFLISPWKHMLWALIRSASVRHFLWVPTTYVFVEK